MDKIVRTRFAPSPTGYMHVGNLRTALYAYLIAKSKGGVFMLRIEDTDQERQVEGAEEIIYSTLRANGLIWDEGPDIGGPVGPYVQSERMKSGMYLDYAKELIQNGSAYYCFCDKTDADQIKINDEVSIKKYDGRCSRLSPDEIAAKLAAGTPYVIRHKIPRSGSTTFHDELFGDITVENETLDDQVLIKRDGMPTYNFANVIDDYTMGITHVVRGNEYLSSAPKYNLLYQAFGWEVPRYIHCAPVMKDATHKLSKRNGDASFEDLIAKGYLKEAILNYIALLGWAPKGDKEIFSLAELIEVFDVSGISKAPAIFDPLKLNYINSEYIKALSEDEFYAMALPWIKQAIKSTDIDTAKVSRLMQKRTQVLSDIPPQLDFIDEMPEYDNALYQNKKMKTTPETAHQALQILVPMAESIGDYSNDTLFAAVTAAAEAAGVKSGWLLWPMRVALCGKEASPGGATELAEILGKDETLSRLKAALSKLGG